ncbi:G5 domain-containing protein [Micromonospora sp. NPDC047548]|uniref:G5 domain-containing protein n=1 Tax=Micromonospora sp. NPDC047548 TaxID=3155624 RepID=UPI0033FFB596
MLAFVGFFAGGAADPRSDASKQQAAGAVAASKKPAPATATGEPSPTAAATPAVKTRIATETKPIPHGTMRVKDSSLRMGVTIVRTEGVDGERTLTYQVTVADGVETARKLVKSEVTVAPVTEVIATGTKRCHPNYAGECVPIADDVDCLRNGGNGPKYISGPVRVIGEDVYDLDRDGNGIGCEDD